MSTTIRRYCDQENNIIRCELIKTIQHVNRVDHVRENDKSVVTDETLDETLELW